MQKPKPLIRVADLKRFIESTKSSLTDEDIFLSEAYKKQLRTLGTFLLKNAGQENLKFDLKIIWDTDPQSMTGATDKRTIILNAGHPAFTALETRAERSECVHGLAFHEFAHWIYTDFSIMKIQRETFLQGQVFPTHMDVTPENEKGLKQLAKKLKNEQIRDLVAQIYHQFDNLLEDVYIERCLSRAFSKTIKRSLQTLNRALFGSSEIQEDKKLPPLWIFYNELLYALEMGEIRPELAAIPELKEVYDRVVLWLPRLSDGADCADTMKRKELVTNLMTENWDLLEPLLVVGESLPEFLRNAQGNGTGNLQLEIRIPTSGGSGDPGNSDDSGDSSDFSNPGETQNGKSCSDTGPASLQASEAEEDPPSEDPLQDIIDEIVRSRIEQEENAEIQRQLQSMANAADSFPIQVDRLMEENPLWYASVKPTCAPIAKKLTRELSRLFKTTQLGNRISGFAFGKRLDTRSLYRLDGKYFSQTRLPSDLPSVAVALLIDASGSMGDFSGVKDGDTQLSKLDIAKQTALILYDFCTSMGFPVMVADHTTGSGCVEIGVAASLLKYDPQDRYRIGAIECGGGNRDGAAINFTLEALKERPEAVKMLFVISDGLPSLYNTQQEGIEDVQKSLKNAQKNGILVFASALRSDMPNLCEIYGDQIFDVTDLSMIPKILSMTVKRELKKIR